MSSLCSILFLSSPLVYRYTERENTAYDYSLLIGNSGLVKSCPIPLTLQSYRLSAILLTLLIRPVYSILIPNSKIPLQGRLRWFDLNEVS